MCQNAMVCARSAAVAPHRGPGITANARQPNKVIGVIGVTAVHDPCRSFHSVRRRPIGNDTDARSTSRLLSSARSDDPRPRRPGRARSQRRACRHPIRPGASGHRVFPGQARVPPGVPPQPPAPPHHSDPTIPNPPPFRTERASQLLFARARNNQHVRTESGTCHPGGHARQIAGGARTF